MRRLIWLQWRAMMHRDDLKGLVTINEIASHAQYFLAVCIERGMGKGASILDTTPRTVLNHIKWLQCLLGESLIQDVPPGQPMKLTKRGRKVAKDLKKDFFGGVKNLDADKMDGVVGKSFIDVIKAPYWSYKKQSSVDRDTLEEISKQTGASHGPNSPIAESTP